MSALDSNHLSGVAQTATVEVAYPAEFHFRIIVEKCVAVFSLLEAAVGGHKVTSPLSACRVSSNGRYRSFSLSVMICDRDELTALDAKLKKVPGVRMVL